MHNVATHWNILRTFSLDPGAERTEHTGCSKLTSSVMKFSIVACWTLGEEVAARRRMTGSMSLSGFSMVVQYIEVYPHMVSVNEEFVCELVAEGERMTDL